MSSRKAHPKRDRKKTDRFGASVKPKAVVEVDQASKRDRSSDDSLADSVEEDCASSPEQVYRPSPPASRNTSPVNVETVDPKDSVSRAQEGDGEKAAPSLLHKKNDVPIATASLDHLCQRWCYRNSRREPDLRHEKVRAYLNSKGIKYDENNHAEYILDLEAIEKLTETGRFTDYIVDEATLGLRQRRVQECRQKMVALNASKVSKADHDKWAAEFNQLKAALKSAEAEAQKKYTMDNIGVFEGKHPECISAVLMNELLQLTRALHWLATRAIDPDVETRRGAIAAFSDLQSAYCSQSSLYEMNVASKESASLFRERYRQVVRSAEVRF